MPHTPAASRARSVDRRTCRRWSLESPSPRCSTRNSPRVMQPAEFGIEEVVAEDRDYAGSRFAEVRDAVWRAPYPGTLDADGRMPTYTVTLRNVSYGLLKMPF